jgi:BioD-like phosphotransacetylase family protein
MLSAVRDIAIVLLAVQSIVIGVLLAILLLQIRSLVRMLRDEVAPILHTTQDTAHRVDGTVHLVSDTVIRPLIKLNSFMAGVRKGADTLLFFRGRVPRRQHTSPEISRRVPPADLS